MRLLLALFLLIPLSARAANAWRDTEELVDARDYGAVPDDGLSDATALTTALATGKCVQLEEGQYELGSSSFSLTGVGRCLLGQGYNTILNGTPASGAIFDIGDGSTSTQYVIVSDIRLTGTATLGMEVDTVSYIRVSNIAIKGCTCTGGYKFNNVQVSKFDSLVTHDASGLTGKGFEFTGYINANLFNELNASNSSSTHGFYIDTASGMQGNVFNSITAQSNTYGFYINQNAPGGNVVNGLYTESNDTSAIVLGDASNAARVARGWTFNGLYLQGASSGTGRGPMIDVSQAQAITFNSPSMYGLYADTSTYVTFGAGCTTSPEAIPLVDPSDGSISAITLATGGAGCSSTPTVTITGSGGSSATATAVRTSDVVTSITVTASGSGYPSAPYPVGVRYQKAYRVQFNSPIVMFNTTGSAVDYTLPLFPFIAKHTSADAAAGITVINDLVEDYPANVMHGRETDTHVIMRMGADGIVETFEYTPPVWP